MNSNIFLSSLGSPSSKAKAKAKAKGQQSPSKEKDFLNTVNDLTREMYQKKDPMPVTGQRFEGDILLNHGDRLRNKDKDKEHLIKDLKEEVKSLKQRMILVIEKDEEIYKLKCDNELLRKDVAEYQSTTVTDESLRVSNVELTRVVNDLQVQMETLGEENLKLKHKVIHLYRENERLSVLPDSHDSPDSHSKLQGISDEVLGAFIRSRASVNR
jgi:hypothetical protein